MSQASVRAPAQKNSDAVEAAFAAVPAEMIAEIIDGELRVMPRPAPKHARAAGRLNNELDGPFDRGRGGPGGWVFLLEPEIHLGPGPDKLVPDVAGWRRERLPQMPESSAISVAPDWVCEVISPSSVKDDRVSKPTIYAREAVPFMWIVDPLSQTLEVFRLEGGFWLRIAAFSGDEKVRAEPFAAIALDLAALWAW